MSAATSAIVKEEHQNSVCMYCGAELGDEWSYELVDGLEYKVIMCQCGKEARIRIRQTLTIDQFAKTLALDWGNIKQPHP